jgi:hydroxymethylbilane synthase
MRHTVAMHQPATHPPSEPLRLIARGSALSRRQVDEATPLLEIATGSADMEIRWTETPGDRNQETWLNDSPGDFFTRDLDVAILDGQADLALHSAKDLPSPLPEGLMIGATVPSIAEWECLVTPHSATLSDLPAGAVIGVSCDRRRDGLARLRPDLIAKPIRGSVPDRIEQMDRGEYDGLLLAAVGLIRLGMSDRISQVFSRDELPAPQGQGSLALVIRSDDEPLRRMLCPLNLVRQEVAHGTR